MKQFTETFSRFLQRNYSGPVSATDTIIKYSADPENGVIPMIDKYDYPKANETYVILIERLNEPYGIAWPGGIGEKISLPKNAIKESKEETGLTVTLDDFLRPFLALSGVNDDPREFISTNVYTAKGKGIIKPDPKEDAKRAFVVTHDELYDLTQKKDVWAMERHRRIGVLYLDYIGYDKAKNEATEIRALIAEEYRL